MGTSVVLRACRRCPRHSGAPPRRSASCRPEGARSSRSTAWTARARRRRNSPEGFFRDSFDLTALVDQLLAPFAAGDAFRRRAFDHRADARVAGVDEHAPPEAVLLLDGLFLHRDELRDRWDLSILLDVPPHVAAERIAQRDGITPTARYVRGQQIYFAACDPRARATLVLGW